MYVINNFVKVLLFIWQLPQNVIGFFYFIYLKTQNKILKIEHERERCFIKSEVAVSLGYFIFWNMDYDNKVFFITEVNKDHEYGHSIQSVILGPLYLFIVGIPSSMRTLYSRYYYQKHGVKWKRHYCGFPENWADRLANVDSTNGLRLP